MERGRDQSANYNWQEKARELHQGLSAERNPVNADCNGDFRHAFILPASAA